MVVYPFPLKNVSDVVIRSKNSFRVEDACYIVSDIQCSLVSQQAREMKTILVLTRMQVNETAPTSERCYFINALSHDTENDGNILHEIFSWVFRSFQEYLTFIQPIVHERLMKTGVPKEKPPDPP